MRMPEVQTGHFQAAWSFKAWTHQAWRKLSWFIDAFRDWRQKSWRSKPILSIRARLIVVALLAIAPLMLERVRGFERTRTERVELALARMTDLARSGAEDRKSTRLNSSHPSISYAVFC